MTTLNRSAEIIAFPPRGRFAVADEVASNARMPALASKIVSGAWYHEEAVREERNRSN